jgi:hypothetical protein
MANRVKFTLARRARFLERIALGWSVTDGAKAVGVTPRTIYDHLSADGPFRAEYEHAVEVGSDVLEDEARRRAVDGVSRERGIYHQGKVVGTYVETEYSDRLLMFLLKARRPLRFRESVDVRHSGTVQHRHTHDLSRLSDGELAQLESLVAAATVDARRN